MASYRFVSLAIIILISIVSTWSLITISPQSICEDVTSDLCQIRFVLSTPNTSETIAAASSWNNHITDMNNINGSCTISSNGLTVTAPEGSNIVICLFTIITGTAIPLISLGESFNNQILPAIVYSNYDLKFTPSDLLSSGSCTSPLSQASCVGTFEFPSNLLPITVETTSDISLLSCSSPQLSSINTNSILFPNPNENQHIKTYSFQLHDTIQLSTPISIQCQLTISKHPVSPYFNVYKNTMRLYSSQSIVYSTMQIIPLPICANPVSSMCVVAFYFDERIPVEELSVSPLSYLYQSLTKPNRAVCQLATNLPQIPGMKVLCNTYRKPFNTPQTISTPNPFITTQQYNPFPIVKWAFYGEYFGGIKLVSDFTDSKFLLPISTTIWQEQICNNNNSPVCIGTFISAYQGPSVQIRLSTPPFQVIDFIHCYADSEGKKLMKVNYDHLFTISDQNNIVRLTNQTQPSQCTIGYYKGFNQRWTNPTDTTNSTLKLLTYRESTSENIYVSYSSFLPQSNLPMFNVSNVLYNAIPLTYDANSNCQDHNSVFCTINFHVSWVNNQIGMFNYMRSFDVHVPGADIDYAITYNTFNLTSSGFSRVLTDVTAMRLNSTSTIPNKNENGDVYFRITIDQLDAANALFTTPFGSGLYSESYDPNFSLQTRPYRQTVSLTYRKAYLIEYTNVQPTLIGYNGDLINYDITTQPQGFKAQNYTTIFSPPTVIQSGPTCYDPKTSFCSVSVHRHVKEDPWIYLSSSDNFYEYFLTTFTSLLGQPPPLYSIDGHIVLALNLWIIVGDYIYLDANSSLSLRLQYGLDEVVTFTTFAPVRDGDGNVISTPNPLGPSYPPIATATHSFPFIARLSYLTDFQPTFHANCEDLRDWTCTLTWTSESAIIVQASTEPMILVQHRIPKVSNTVELVSEAELLSWPSNKQTEYIFGRLANDWVIQPGTIKELITPISTNAQTYNTIPFISSDGQMLVPQMSTQNLTTWQLATNFQTDPSDYLPSKDIPPGLLPVPYGDVYVWPEIIPGEVGSDYDYIAVKAMLNPLIVLKDPDGPSNFTNFDMLQSIVSGVLAAPINGSIGMIPQFPFFPIRDQYITYTTTFGLNYNPASQAMFVEPIIVSNLPVLNPEFIKPFRVPRIGYTPVDIFPHDDCNNSYKTGRITCTFGGTLYGSPSKPIENFTYLSYVNIAHNPLIPEGAFAIYSRPVDPLEHAANAQYQVGALFLDRPSNFCALHIFEQYRNQTIYVYLMLIDPNHGTPESLLLQRPKLVAGVNTPVFMNVQYNQSDPYPALSAILSNPALLAFPPYTAVGGNQGTFFPIPNIMTGPLIQVTSKQMKYSQAQIIDGYTLIMYTFNANVTGPIDIHTNFGYDIPIPCFAVPYNENALPVNFDAPPINTTQWKSILTTTQETIGTTSTPWDINVTTLPTTFNIDNINVELPITSWIYPNNPILPYTQMKPAINDYIQEYSACITYIQLNHQYPIYTDTILHTFSSPSWSELTFIPAAGLPGSVSIKNLPGSANATYPYYSPSSTLQQPDKLEPGVGNTSFIVTITVSIILSIIVSIIF